MPIASSYPFLNILWDMLIFTALIMWIWIAIACFADIFRRRDMGGFAKAIWIIGLIVVPLLTALIYILARGGGMAARQQAALKQAKSQTDDYIRGIAAKSPADQISDAKKLLDAGTITAEEFAKLKAKALA